MVISFEIKMKDEGNNMNEKSQFKELWGIFLAFFKIGSFTFGGGYAMIPLIEKEVVDKKAWISKEDIIDVFAVAQSIPGAIAINSATLIGYKIKKKKGSYAATLGVILPSFLIILLIATVFSKFQDNIIVQNAFKGIRPAVVALIFIAAVNIGKTAIKDKISLVIALVAFTLILVFDVHAIFAVIGGAVVGLVLYKIPNNKSKYICNKDV